MVLLCGRIGKFFEGIVWMVIVLRWILWGGVDDVMIVGVKESCWFVCEVGICDGAVIFFLGILRLSFLDKVIVCIED